MDVQFYDVLVAKDYETRQNGKSEKRTQWNRVGRAWTSKSGESISFELYLIPNERYVVQMRNRGQVSEVSKSEDAVV